MVTRFFVILFLLAFVFCWFFSVNNNEEPKNFQTTIMRKQSEPYNKAMPPVEYWDVKLVKTNVPYLCILTLVNQHTKIKYQLNVRWVWKLDRASFVRGDGVSIGYITTLMDNVEIYYDFLDELNNTYNKKQSYKLKY